MSLAEDRRATKARHRPEGGGVFAPALGGGSGASRATGGPAAQLLPGALGGPGGDGSMRKGSPS